MRLCTHTRLTHLRAGKDKSDNLRQPSQFTEHGKECSEKVSSVLKHTQLINDKVGNLNTSLSIANAHDFSTLSYFLIVTLKIRFLFGILFGAAVFSPLFYQNKCGRRYS